MHIKKFEIHHFKSFQHVTIQFNADINIFTGVNNSGKTTVLEAVALWHECFAKLLQRAKTNINEENATSYDKDDYVLGSTQIRYFPSDQLNSVRSSNFEDIYYKKDKQIPIQLVAELEHEDNHITIGFQIKSLNYTYDITLIDFQQFDFKKFNKFFKKLPQPLNIHYASPVAAIQLVEDFMTVPVIKDNILRREAVKALRNRLYLLYRNFNSSLFYEYLSNLNYVLYANQQQLVLQTVSDIQKDKRVIFTFTNQQDATEKDIALLGSGTLQIVEILLGLYQNDGQCDMSLILLDEPDSHIHRDIQRRLLEVISKFSATNQVLMTTHNEALIREAHPSQLFHLENKAINHYQPLQTTNLEKIIKPLNTKQTFKGIYPLQTNKIINAINPRNGLDFISAIEADKIIFVEGEDDAQYIYTLLQKAVLPQNKLQYVFWVLQGVDTIWKEIIQYKTVFEQIKNEKTLWEKSYLIIDRDFWNDAQIADLTVSLANSPIHLKTYSWTACTIESTLLTDHFRLATLLQKWLAITYQKNITTEELRTAIAKEYAQQGEVLRAKLAENKMIENLTFEQVKIKKLISTTKQLFVKELNPKGSLDLHDAKYNTVLREHIKTCFANQKHYKLMKKTEVALLFNAVLAPYEVVFEIEKDFISLLQLVDNTTWLAAWDFLRELC